MTVSGCCRHCKSSARCTARGQGGDKWGLLMVSIVLKFTYTKQAGHPTKTTPLPAAAPACPAGFPVPPARSPWATAPWGCGRSPGDLPSNRAPWCYRCEPFSRGMGLSTTNTSFMGLDRPWCPNPQGRGRAKDGQVLVPCHLIVVLRCREHVQVPVCCPGRPHTRTGEATASVVRTDCGKVPLPVQVLVPRHLCYPKRKRSRSMSVSLSRSAA